MNRQDTREAAKLMLDWADEKCNVSSANKYGKIVREWRIEPRPLWNWSTTVYRREPIKRLRCYNYAECVNFLDYIVSSKDKTDPVPSLIIKSVTISYHQGLQTLIELRTMDGYACRTVDPHTLCAEYQYSDGRPCGVIEEDAV